MDKKQNPFDKIIVRSKILRDLWNTIDALNADNLIVDHHNVEIYIKIHSLDKLHNARKLAQAVFPGWKDKLNLKWIYGFFACASWGDTEHPLLYIELHTAIKNFPPELLGENCQIKEILRKEKRIVCNYPTITN